MIFADLDIAEDLVHRLLVDDRADLGLRIEAVADAEFLDLFDKLFAEFLVDLFVNDEPRRSRAPLSARAECTPQRAFDRVVDIGVVHHDDRVLAAHFEADDLVVAGTLLGDDPPGRGRAGERDQPNILDGRQAPRRRLRRGR